MRRPSAASLAEKMTEMYLRALSAALNVLTEKMTEMYLRALSAALNVLTQEQATSC